MTLFKVVKGENFGGPPEWDAKYFSQKENAIAHFQKICAEENFRYSKNEFKKFINGRCDSIKGLKERGILYVALSKIETED